MPPATIRRVLHVDMDSFFVSVERRRNPTLLGRPVVVGADPKGGAGRGVVCAASYEARAYGVESAMPISWAFRALQKCPDAVYLPPDGRIYAEASSEVAEFLEDRVPDLVRGSIDEFYGDLTGCERLFGDLFAYSRQLKAEIQRRLSLPATIGLATNRLVAKIAAGEAKPDGARWVPPGEEAAFLAPLPIQKLIGVGPEFARELAEMGIRRIGDLVNVGAARLAERFGWGGKVLAHRALGLDERLDEGGNCSSTSLVTRSISRDETFETDSEDPTWILGRLSALVEDACTELRRSRRRARTVTLRIRYSDFVTRTRSRTIPPTDLDTVFFALLEELFRHEAFGPSSRRVRVRLIGVRLSNLLAPGLQFLAFDDQERKMGDVLRAADRVRERHGDGKIHLGRSLPEATEPPTFWLQE